MRADDRRVEHLHAMHPLAQGGERFEESFEYAAAAQAPEALPEALSRRRRACRHWLIAVPSAMIKISYSGYRFPPEIIQHAIWLYIRFTLSFRDVEDLLAERGIMVSYETVRRWVNHFGPMVAADPAQTPTQTPHDLASRRSLSENLERGVFPSGTPARRSHFPGLIPGLKFLMKHRFHRAFPAHALFQN